MASGAFGVFQCEYVAIAGVEGRDKFSRLVVFYPEMPDVTKRDVVAFCGFYLGDFADFGLRHFKQGFKLILLQEVVCFDKFFAGIVCLEESR